MDRKSENFQLKYLVLNIGSVVVKHRPNKKEWISQAIFILFCYIRKGEGITNFLKENSMKYKALFLDIDGTILGTNHEYTDLTKQAIYEARNQGLEVFIATGRPLHEIKQLANELSIVSFIAYNGALAKYNNEVLVYESIGEQITKKIITITKEFGHEIIAYTRDKSLITTFQDPLMKDFLAHFRIEETEQLEEKHLSEILSMTVLKIDENTRSTYEGLENIHFTQVNVDGFRSCYDITKYGVNKGNAVKKILNYLNISPDEAIAFGDGMNDVQMLQAVEESFAMGNANPNLFPYAKYKTKSAEESGIYYGLRQLEII